MQNYILVVEGQLEMVGDREEIEAARVAFPIGTKFDVIFGRFLTKTEARAANVRYPQRRVKAVTSKKKPAKKTTARKPTGLVQGHVAQ